MACLCCLQCVTAGPEIVYELTLLARNDPHGRCRALADSLGAEVQAAFNEAVPEFTPYDREDVGTRFLRDTSRALQVRVCSRTYCSKPRNWDWCLWNGCSCSCGGRRELQTRVDNSSDSAKIVQTKQNLDIMLAVRGKALGCELGLLLEKVQG